MNVVHHDAVCLNKCMNSDCYKFASRPTHGPLSNNRHTDKLNWAPLHHVVQQVEANVRQDLLDVAGTPQQHGFTFCTDGFTSTDKTPLLNVISVTPHGAQFVKAINAEGNPKTAEWIASQMEDALAVMGPENCVAFCTDNAANCKRAGELLTSKDGYKHIFWLPCAAHSLDLFMEDVGKLAWAECIISDCRSIISFINNHEWSLALYKHHSRKGMNLVLLKPGEKYEKVDA